MKNDLDKKLKELPEADRERFLKGKYRELQLINRLDRITDRYNRLPRLMEKSLALMKSFFGVEIAAVQLTSAEQLENHGFFFSGPSGASDAMQSAAHDLLVQFLGEPQIDLRQQHDKGAFAASGLRNTLAIPMVITSEIAGAFLIANREEPFTDSDVHYLKVFSSQLDNAVIHARVLDDYRKTARDLKQRVRQLNVLYEMSLSLGLGFDFESLAKRIIESTQQIVPFDRCSIMLYDKKNDDLKTEVVVGEKQKIRLVHLSRGKGIAGLALLSKRPILAENGSDDERFIPFEFQGIKIRKIHSLVSIPLMAEDKPLGVMNFCMLSRKRALQAKDMDTLGVAAHMVAMALQRQQFYHLSIKDELTGLYSFRYFKERLQEEVSRARRYRMVVGLIIFDIDHFKKVNDTYGHPFGNIVLKKVANVISHSIRHGVDMPARFGGEEMAVILPHTNEHGAYILADRIRQRVEALDFDCEGKTVKVTISGGVSGFPTHAEDGDTLLKKADEALYAAKQNGRNRVVLAP